MQLRFSATATRLESGAGEALTVAPSPAALANTCFRHDPPTGAELEHAIDVIEDALMAVKLQRAHGARLATIEPTLRQLPGLDVEGAVMSRDAIEALFQQLASIALGRPDPGAAVVARREVAAALLITRECMHHLGFESIQVGPASSTRHGRAVRPGTAGPRAPG
ncbi:MAG: hypothetical protein HY855_23250 [Burkholderiales bacterium]|nr:hypothetical protein [Burkholderiales bacterium]